VTAWAPTSASEEADLIWNRTTSTSEEALLKRGNLII
jgi:hypothetical protein